MPEHESAQRKRPGKQAVSRAHITRMAAIVRCNYGAGYKRTETKFLVPRTGDAVCGAR
jgi:hypothetical protein